MITIYYPYWEAGKTWDELRYSLRSLEKHLKEDFLVCIVGDCPGWLQNVVHIPYSRDMRHTSLWNTNRMLELFLSDLTISELANLEISEFDNLTIKKEKNTQCPIINTQYPKNEKRTNNEFVRMYDDVYLLRDMQVNEMKVTRIVRDANEVDSIKSGGSVWIKQITETMYALHQRGYFGYLTESHCPEVFSKTNMEVILKSFDLRNKELLTSTLYYNVFPYDTSIKDKKTQRALFYGDETEYGFSSENIAEKCADKWFLNHNDTGLNNELKQFLTERFPDKSRFEV